MKVFISMLALGFLIYYLRAGRRTHYIRFEKGTIKFFPVLPGVASISELAREEEKHNAKILREKLRILTGVLALISATFFFLRSFFPELLSSILNSISSFFNY